MKSCETYETLISAFIDGELAGSDQAELMEHMASCPSCQAYFDDQIAIHDAMERLQAQAPEGFAASVMERVRSTPQEKPEKKAVPFPRWRRWTALAACCAAAVLGVWAFGGSLDQAKVTTVYYRSADSAMPELYSANQDAEVPRAAQAEEKSAATDASAEDTAEKEAAYSLESEPAMAPAFGDSAPSDGDSAPSRTAALNCRAALFTGSDIAANWVADNLSMTWISGETYEVTEEQFLQLRGLLEQEGAAFTEEAGTGAERYLLCAE